VNIGVIPETFLERVALWLRLVPVPVLDLLFGSLKARIIMAGVKLGVFEALRDQSRTAAELADALRLDQVALELLLRVLTHVKYLKERKARYGLSPLARRAMVTGAPTGLTSYARWHETQWRLLEQLETLVRTGCGVDFHETLRDQQAWGHYQRAMLEVARFDAATLARLAPIPAGATRLIDLAGGHGLLGAAICRRHPPMRSTVIDLPQAIEHSRALAREAGHSDLVDHREGDLLNDPLEESDVALLSNILHHFCSTQVTALLGRVRAVLRPGGTVAIWELESPRSGSRVDHGDLVALFFRLTSTSGAYHGTQYAHWLAAAGFSAVRVLRPRSSPGRVLALARAGGSDSWPSRGRLFALRLPFIRQRTSCYDGKQGL
jgi:O-methyltransferase domain/Dimerisation domain